jgi:hypothetical protein
MDSCIPKEEEELFVRPCSFLSCTEILDRVSSSSFSVSLSVWKRGTFFDICVYLKCPENIHHKTNKEVFLLLMGKPLHHLAISLHVFSQLTVYVVKS